MKIALTISITLCNISAIDLMGDEMASLLSPVV